MSRVLENLSRVVRPSLFTSTANTPMCPSTYECDLLLQDSAPKLYLRPAFLIGRIDRMMHVQHPFHSCGR